MAPHANGWARSLNATEGKCLQHCSNDHAGKLVRATNERERKGDGYRQTRELRELARLMAFRQHANLALQVRVVDVHATLWAAMPRSDTLHMGFAWLDGHELCTTHQVLFETPCPPCHAASSPSWLPCALSSQQLLLHRRHQHSSLMLMV